MIQPTAHPARRTVLGSGLGLAGGLALWAAGTTNVAAAPRSANGRWSGKTSANGWPVIESAPAHRIEGSPVNVSLLDGDVAIVLLHVVRRFHYELSALKKGQVTGHSTETSCKVDFESNYLSGTAVAIRAGMYPTGAGGCLFPHEVAIVRDILTECEGVVRWGGDDKQLPKQGHFQIDVAPGDNALKDVAQKINGWSRTPGMGAGTPVDPFRKNRRTAAKHLADRQRATA